MPAAANVWLRRDGRDSAHGVHSASDVLPHGKRAHLGDGHAVLLGDQHHAVGVVARPVLPLLASVRGERRGGEGVPQRADVVLVTGNSAYTHAVNLSANGLLGGNIQAMTWMVYGANGYTGRLVARLAVARGERPVLAGRSPQVGDLAADLGLEHRIFGLDQATTGLDGIDAVAHCAGPFSATSRPMVDACLATGR